MKIGILTFHRALNYGAVLQCFALYKTLSMKGFDVEVIDYRPESIEKYRMAFSQQAFKNIKGIISRLRYIFSCLLLVCSKRKTRKKFDAFLIDNMKYSKVVKNATEIPSYYDVIFFGSDQIWNPELLNGFDPVYYGQFPKGKTKFITYAASIGRLGVITESSSRLFEEFIRKYDKISVRENALGKFLHEKYAINSETVCDPSLLLEKESYEKIAKKTNEQNYLLIFEQFRNPDAYSLAKRIAKQIGASVITISAETNPLRYSPCKCISEVSPAEFLGYIKYAKCIITSSFHVTSFSIIMQKDFYTTMRANNNDRVETILGIAGLSERLIDAKGDIKFSSIDYSGVKSRLDSYKENSLKFITEQCNNI